MTEKIESEKKRDAWSPLSKEQFPAEPKLHPMQYSLPVSFRDHFGQMSRVLGPFVSVNRLERMKEVLSRRSRKVVCIFENTHHTHNISAVLRSVDAFGFQDAFFLYDDSTMVFRARDTVERGSSAWLTCKRMSSFTGLVHSLKSSNYCVVCVTLPSFARTGEHFSIEIPSFGVEEFGTAHFEKFLMGRRIALVFGNEKYGLQNRWSSVADALVHVPMHGFVESLNLSVCAGILLQKFRECQVETEANLSQVEHGGLGPGIAVYLSDFERQLLLESFLAKSVEIGAQVMSNKFDELEPYFNFVRYGKFFTLPT